MVKETANEGQGEMEIAASAESIIIADAIYGGLSEIAGGLRAIAKALEGDAEPEGEGETYLDGSRK